MEISIRRLKDQFDRRGQVLKPPVQLRPGDLVQYVVKNSGSVSFDLTLLYVNNKFGIGAHFPEIGELNRFQPGDTRRLPIIRIDDGTLGREHLIAIRR